jgi:hypothetical protein
MLRSAMYPRLLLLAGLMTYGHSQVMSQAVRTLPTQPQLKRSSRIRVHTGAEWQEGKLILTSPDSIGLSGKSGDVRLTKAAVDGVWVRRHNTLLGFLIGTAAGAAGFAITTSVLDDGDVPELDDLIGGAIWAGSALLGTVAGGLTTHWKRVYP